jgi:antitoxin component YwqK of YwqJK toxin-antitoxin module
MKKLFSIAICLLIIAPLMIAQKALLFKTEPGEHAAQNAIGSSAIHSFVSFRSAHLVTTPLRVIDLFPNHPREKEKELILYHEDGSKKLMTFARGNSFHNKWQTWYADNFPCDEGNFKKGIPDGEWKVWYPGGQLKYLRTYNADLLITLKNEWVRQPRHSFYPITAIAREDISRAAWYINSRYSFYTTVPAPEGLPAAELLRHNTTTGNNSYIPPFSEGLLHGLYVNYFSSGRVKDSGYYKYGLREGDWMECTNDGSVTAKGFYLQGAKKGAWKYYRAKQLVLLKEYDRSGKEIYSKSFQ